MESDPMTDSPGSLRSELDRFVEELRERGTSECAIAAILTAGAAAAMRAAEMSPDEGAELMRRSVAMLYQEAHPN